MWVKKYTMYKYQKSKKLSSHDEYNMLALIPREIFTRKYFMRFVLAADNSNQLT